jgi:hypothetical protein
LIPLPLAFPTIPSLYLRGFPVISFAGDPEIWEEILPGGLRFSVSGFQFNK